MFLSVFICALPTSRDEIGITHWTAIQDMHDGLAEWSKALASGASPKGRGFEPHSRHLRAFCANDVDGYNVVSSW